MTLNRLSPTAARLARHSVLQAAVDTSARCGDRDEYRGLFNRAANTSPTIWAAQQAGAQGFCAGCSARAACEELALRYGAVDRSTDDLVRGGRRGLDLAVTREVRQPGRIAAAVTADRLEAARQRYTLTYGMKAGPVTRRGLRRTAVQRIGEVVMRLAARGDAWNIAVENADGIDITDEFAFAAQEFAALPAAA
ncbi:transcription factor WhiB [Streptomyces sp. NPDC002225]|uniref:transcription factor WhiB n=1 Tax=Streptomyces sp. NPDC002225 TaxID=3154413 RepID=UPI00331B5F72